MYGVNPDDIKRVFKRTKKGLLVKIEDHVIARLDDESDFVLEFSRQPQYEGYVLVLMPGEGVMVDPPAATAHTHRPSGV